MRIFLITTFCAGFAVLGALVVRWSTSFERLREQHDVAAAWFAVIGGIYGVVLAFVLVSSWGRFEDARASVEFEANALLDVWRHAAVLPSPAGGQLRALTLQYATTVLEKEWPAMAEGREDPESQAVFDRMWTALLAVPAGDAKQVVVFQNTLAKMDDLSDARRARVVFSQVSLPGILWGFLAFGGAATMSFGYFFGLPRIAPQLLMTALLAGTIGAALGLIAELQTPFAGSFRVMSYSLARLGELSRETSTDTPAN